MKYKRTKFEGNSEKAKEIMEQWEEKTTKKLEQQHQNLRKPTREEIKQRD